MKHIAIIGAGPAGLMAAEAALAQGARVDIYDAMPSAGRKFLMAGRGGGGNNLCSTVFDDAAAARWCERRSVARLTRIELSANRLGDEGLAFHGELGLRATQAPLTQRQTHDDLTAWFDGAATLPGRLRIGLAHGSVQGILSDDVDSPNPIAPDRASSASLDYLALGDWHGCRRIDDRTWYSGTPEPDRFKANEPGHALLVELPHPGAIPTVTRLATARFTWTAWEARLEVASDIDVVSARLADAGSMVDAVSRKS
jgi:hypothetical protein